MESNINTILRDFLTLKFKKHGEELLKEIESPEWTILLSSINTEDLLQFLEQNHLYDPNDEFAGSNMERVSVLVPFDGKEVSSQWLSWLRSCACYPWQIDPFGEDGYSHPLRTEELQIQLAHSSFLGHPFAQNFLRRLARHYFKLQKRHPFWKGKEDTIHKYKHYRFPVNSSEDFKLVGQVLESDSKILDFSKMPKDEFNLHFEKLARIELQGYFNRDELPKKTAEVKIFKITVFGQNPTESSIWKSLLSKFMKYEVKDSNNVSGMMTLDDLQFHFSFTASSWTPESKQDGVVFTDTHSDPLSLYGTLQTKAALFINTKRPNSVPASYKFFLSENKRFWY